ncbi:1,4-dihydroxy-2-naphthoate polyprenyltransferase [Plantibacter sp. CFBP 8775]|uniref:1,4-dihydroxy-2-naphthoate polyprenyltransferase n=1 Tax=Plantibacter sp. CFBP 8775 TaxID=2774038 RepID=UPI001785F091|nr:1,4-dihydroxy-2-naphthoate polyprenyltransferase [Plantibacter sp. CFBP 8775]
MAHGARPAAPKQQKTSAQRPTAGRGANGGRSGNPARGGGRKVPLAKPATFGDWVGAARIRTLPMAVAPVLIGTGAATIIAGPGVYHPVRALLCLVVALALQIGVNYANDYSDGIRGTDDLRVGPSRLTGSGAAKPKTVLAVALVFFGIAAVAGIVLTILTQFWWLLLVGAVAIVAAWFYTGGKRPYGYFALGEVFVFVFFGLVATLGTTFVQVGTVNQEAWFGAIGAGLIACAALVVNNLRDLEQDKAVGKRTLSTFIGRIASKVLYCVLLLVPFGIAAFLALFYPIAWFAMFALLAAIPACVIVLFSTTAREQILALKLTGLVQLAFGVVLGLAFFYTPGIAS